MATYRRKLLDENGDTIIPAMTGDETGWVKTGDIDDGAVTAGKIDFSTISGTLTLPSGSSVYTLLQQSNCRKFGNIVDIEIRGQLTANAWTAGVSKTNQILVPEGFRPPKEITLIGYLGNSNYVQLWIGTNGQVEIRPSINITTGTNFGAHMCYMV